MTLFRILVGIVVILHLGTNHLGEKADQATSFSLSDYVQSLSTGTDSVVQLSCALLILIGLLTRAAAIPLMIFAMMTIVSGKLPTINFHDIFFDTNQDLDTRGLGSLIRDVHGAFIILFGCVFLFLDGAGRPSVDALIMDRLMARRPVHPVPVGE